MATNDMNWFLRRVYITSNIDNDSLLFHEIEQKQGVLKPDPRSGHRIVANDSNLYSIGGYNPDFWDALNEDEHTYYPLFKELWQFNFVSRLWKKLETTGPMPLELASHSAMLHGDHLLVFGGTGIPFGSSASNKLNVCDLRTLKWTVIRTSGEFPIKVYGQSMHLFKDDLYIFGGTTGWEYNSELHKLDLKTRKWTLIKATGDIPEGRYRHEVATYQDKFYVFGGGRSYLCYDFEKIPVFDTKSDTWLAVATISDRKHGFPAPRLCHSCVQLGRAAYITGGYNGERIFDDIWKLCLATRKWTKLSITLIEPVYFHSATVTPAGCMYIFGGVTVIDNVRTSKVYKVWLQPPRTLKELCWASIVDYMPSMATLSEDKLLEMGIPSHYVSRVIQSPIPSVCG